MMLFCIEFKNPIEIEALITRFPKGWGFYQLHRSVFYLRNPKENC